LSTRPFDLLRSELHQIRQLANLINLAVWDQQVNLPRQAAEGRGQQLALLATLRHDRMLSNRLFDLAGECAADATLSPEQKIVVREVQDDLNRARRKPVELIAALAEMEARSYAVWIRAREENNFSLTLPVMKEFLKLKQDYASAIAPELTPYDALLDDFERGARTKDILARFAPLRAGVIELRSKFLKGEGGPRAAIDVTTTMQHQRDFLTDIGEHAGFDMTRGRIDPTVHPFMAEMGLHDVRLTTSFRPDDFFFGLFAFLHEMGHGLYEQGMRPEWASTPLSEACSLAMHESQSLLYDRQIGLGFPFQDFLLDRLQLFFPSQVEDLTPERLFKDFNRLGISLNRLSSDELGYTLHIILRTELEAQVVDGTLPLDDLREAWAAKTEHYFGRRPASDAEGVLQDVHWYSGLWGYFPHYLGGAMYAAQLMGSFHREYGKDLEGAELLTQILPWLRKHVHHRGRSVSPEQLMKDATSSGTDPQIYLKYLRDKYELWETL